jgi:hypothetical protein
MDRGSLCRIFGNTSSITSTNKTVLTRPRPRLIKTDFSFVGVIEEYIWDTDHLKLYVKVESNRFFIKIPKISLDNIKMQISQNITIGFDKKDIYFL